MPEDAKPPVPVFVERSPDRRRSDNRYVLEDRGYDVICALEVRCHGALVIRGKVDEEWHGIAIFTDTELLLD